MSDKKPSEIIKARSEELSRDVVKTIEGRVFFRSGWECMFLAVTEYLDSLRTKP